MKNILIVSYFFPPGNFVSSNRPLAFAKNLKAFGFNPTVLTRHWVGDENKWSDMDRKNSSPINVTEHPDYKVVRLPYFSEWYNLCKPFHSSPLLRKLTHMLYTTLGVFYPHESAQECFQTYLEEYLRTNDVDYLMVISSPLNIIRLGHIVSKKTGVKLIVDFRDLWDNELLSGKKLPLASRIRNRLYEFYLKRWLRSARLITSVSSPLVEKIERISPRSKLAVVMNGFDKELQASAMKSPSKPTDKFTFSVIGTLYPSQDLSILINGLKRFLRKSDKSSIKLNFIGVGVFPEVQGALERSLPSENLNITERIPRKDALEILTESNVLFYAGWKGYEGVVSAKFYEYLCSKKGILIAPGDEDIIDGILKKTGAGKIANSSDEFVEIMDTWYSEWQNNGFLRIDSSQKEIDFYSSEYQVKILADAIKKIPT